MNKASVAFAVVAALVLVAECTPVIPKRGICSVQAVGSATFTYDRSTYTGTVDMYRVNEYVIYNFTDKTSQSSSSYHYGYLLLRPDLKESIFRTCDKRGSSTQCTGGTLSTTFPLSSYSYSSTFKPISGKDYDCFAHPDGSKNIAALLFSNDRYRDLIGEWFNLFGQTLTFNYNRVYDYIHDKSDKVFSLNGLDSKWASTASNALTSKCESVVSSDSSSSKPGPGPKPQPSSGSGAAASSKTGSGSGSGSGSSQSSASVMMPSFIGLIALLMTFMFF